MARREEKIAVDKFLSGLLIPERKLRCFFFFFLGGGVLLEVKNKGILPGLKSIYLTDEELQMNYGCNVSTSYKFMGPNLVSSFLLSALCQKTLAKKFDAASLLTSLALWKIE